MKNIFNSVQFNKPATNRFDLSHDVKLSFSMGELVPTCVMECLPGDKVSINVENMLRFAPLISPVMHRVKVKTNYFFVPTRLLWPEWEKWITGDNDVEAPFINFGDQGAIDVPVGSLADYLGYPTGDFNDPPNLPVSPMAIAAYLKIWDDYYRDQNLQDEKFIPLVPGDNNAQYVPYAEGQPLHRAWQHDYFTSALPFAQKGDSVQIPLTVSDDVPVERITADGTAGLIRDADTGALLPGTPLSADAGGVLQSGADTGGAMYDPNGSLVVDIQSDATDINTLRRAFRLQEWLERNARGGTRYIENILAHFGVKSSDARLNRPEYIGGDSQMMVISEVLSTAQNDDSTVPVGQMAGHGISVGGGKRFGYRAEEHGYIIGIISVIPDTAYQQGLHRQFSRFTPTDYAWPTFANIGEQEVLQKEVFATTLNPNLTFGYVPRYSEYKFMNSRVAGEFKTTLAFWHLGRIFATDPALNEAFISCFPSARIFAVTESNEDHIFAHVFNNISAVRKLPRYGIPTI